VVVPEDNVTIFSAVVPMAPDDELVADNTTGANGYTYIGLAVLLIITVDLPAIGGGNVTPLYGAVVAELLFTNATSIVTAVAVPWVVPAAVYVAVIGVIVESVYATVLLTIDDPNNAELVFVELPSLTNKL
jgi:hypothetical protein